MISLLFRFRLLWLGLLLGGLLGALVGLRSLHFDFTSQDLFKSRSADYRTLVKLQQALGRQDNAAVVLVTAPDVLAPEVLQFLGQLRRQLADVPGIIRVHGLPDAYYSAPGQLLPQPILSAGSGAALRKVVMSQPLIAGRIVSRDSQATVLLARVDTELMRFGDLEPVMEALFAAIEQAQTPAGVTVRVTGVPPARVLIVQRMIQDQQTFTPICALLFIFLLWALFRDFRAMAVALWAVLISIVYFVGMLGAAGKTIDILNNVYPTLIFVIGLSDGIHLLFRYRELLARGVGQQPALEQTVQHLAAACFLTSFTTAIGFASLGVARLEILQRFGLWAASGLMIAYVVTVVLIPLILSYLKPIMRPSMKASERRSRRAFLRLSLWVQRHPRKILAVSAVIVCLCIWLGSKINVTNNLYEAFPDDDPMVQTNSLVERHFSGVVPFSIVVEWDSGSPVRPEVLRYLQELSRFLDAQQLSDPGLSIADLIAEANLALNLGAAGQRRIPDSAKLCQQLLGQTRLLLAQRGEAGLVDMLYNEQARMLRIHAWTGDHGANVIGAMFTSIRQRLAADRARQEQLGIRCYLSGDGPVASEGINRLIEDLFSSLILAFGVIFIVMVLLLRSIKTALISMIANVVPLLVTLGFISLSGMDLRVTTVIVFTVSLGLAVDDTIHFMARFRAEFQRHPSYAKALNRTFIGTGRAIVVTTVVLGIGFGVLLTSRFPISRTFALCMEVTVLAALLGDLLFLPACLLVFKPMSRSTPAPPPQSP